MWDGKRDFVNDELRHQYASSLLTLILRIHPFSSLTCFVFRTFVREHGGDPRSRLHAMDSDDEEQPSPLDYARHHGLCKPYYEESIYCDNMPVITSDIIDRDLWDLSNESITNSVNALIKERLTVSRDSMLLLKSMHNSQDAPLNDLVTEDRHRWMLGLKQELPILRTDTELDLLSFGDASMPDLRHVNIPSEIIHKDSDEGFEWPAKYLAYSAQCDAQIKAEKLVVSRDILMRLQDAIHDSFTSQDLAEIEKESMRCRSVGEVSTPVDMADNVETRMSTNYPTLTSTITALGALHTLIACESSSASFRQW
jgi:hypothetical protein